MDINIDTKIMKETSEKMLSLVGELNKNVETMYNMVDNYYLKGDWKGQSFENFYKSMLEDRKVYIDFISSLEVCARSLNDKAEYINGSIESVKK